MNFFGFFGSVYIDFLFSILLKQIIHLALLLLFSLPHAQAMREGFHESDSLCYVMLC